MPRSLYTLISRREKKGQSSLVGGFGSIRRARARFLPSHNKSEADHHQQHRRYPLPSKARLKGRVQASRLSNRICAMMVNLGPYPRISLVWAERISRLLQAPPLFPLSGTI